ncbi:MAG TPA: sigma-70 family RNA polymerase sigma factor [Solirubrobacteraceae bacterium]
MTTLQRAREGDELAFGELTDPHRHELQVHCYRILGSIQDAEDLVQETLLAAWRGLDGFQERASLRAWLYRIATNRCLNFLRDSGRRPTTSETMIEPKPTRITEPMWLEPYPDALIEQLPDGAPGPDARYELRESLRLAFVTALQQLPPRQRAVLVLRDVLGFRAAEVAEMLEVSEASVNSALPRAREALETRLPAGRRERAPLPSSAAEKRLVDGFADAFEHGDVDALVALLTSDVRITMPPQPFEYTGHEAVAGFLGVRFAERAGRRVQLVPTRANGQPAFAVYMEDGQLMRWYVLLVLTLGDEQIAAMTAFRDSAVLQAFGLPRTLHG